MIYVCFSIHVSGKEKEKTDMTTKLTSVTTVKTYPYYNNYHGHTLADLQQVYRGLKSNNKDRPMVYLSGDFGPDCRVG